MRASIHSRRRGIALLLVLAVIGLATLIGMAMLSAASLQAQISANTQKGAMADYLADTAVQTAAYYLQANLANMPASWGTTVGYTIHATTISITGVDGSFDVSAVPTSVADQYTITGLGRSSGTDPVTRTHTVTLKVLRATPTYAAGFGGNVTVNNRNYFNGVALVNGTISPAPNALYFAGGTRTSFTSSEYAVPASGGINYYGGGVANGTYTTPTGAVGSPQSLVSSGSYTLGSPSTLNTTLNTSTNPGRVFYFPGDLTITGAGTYNATLIVKGRLIFSTPNPSTVTITRQAGFPAVLLDGTLTIPNNTKNLTLNVNGAAWLGSGSTWGTGSLVAGTNVNINGALLMPSAKTLGYPGGSANLTVNYTSSNVDIINLTTAAQPITGVKFVSWNQ